MARNLTSILRSRKRRGSEPRSGGVAEGATIGFEQRFGRGRSEWSGVCSAVEQGGSDVDATAAAEKPRPAELRIRLGIRNDPNASPR